MITQSQEIAQNSTNSIGQMLRAFWEMHVIASAPDYIDDEKLTVDKPENREQ